VPLCDLAERTDRGAVWHGHPGPFALVRPEATGSHSALAARPEPKARRFRQLVSAAEPRGLPTLGIGRNPSL